LQKLGNDWQQVKKAVQKFDEERFILRKLNDLEVRKECQMEITNRFVAVENLSDGADVKKVCLNIKQNIKTSAKESLMSARIEAA